MGLPPLVFVAASFAANCWPEVDESIKGGGAGAGGGFFCFFLLPPLDFFGGGCWGGVAVAEVGEAGCGHQADPANADDADCSLFVAHLRE